MTPAGPASPDSHGRTNWRMSRCRWSRSRSREARRHLPDDPLRIDRMGLVLARASSVFHQSRIAPSIVRANSVPLAVKQGQEQLEASGGVAMQVHLARVTEREHRRRRCRSAPPAPGRPSAGTPPREIRVPTISSVSQPCIMSELGLRPEQADGAGNEGKVVRQHRLSEQRLGDACAEQIGDRDNLLGCARRARADQYRHLLPRSAHRRPRRSAS